MTATLVLALRKYTKVRLLTSGAGLGPRIRKDDKLKVPASREAQNERTRTVILANARTQAQLPFTFRISQIEPLRIRLFDEVNFPFALPMF